MSAPPPAVNGSGDLAEPVETHTRATTVLRNRSRQFARRVAAWHKPVVRGLRRRARRRELHAMERAASTCEAEIACLAGGTGPIVVGPWLAEVGYEVLYWLPFLRWVCQAHRIAPERLVIVSRGGMARAYDGLAASYVDIFDILTPDELAARNQARRVTGEGGGQKQSSLSTLDRDLLDAVVRRAGVPGAAVLHPSLMFRLFREVWYGNLAAERFWRCTRYTRIQDRGDEALDFPGLPEHFIAVKVYTGPALHATDASQTLVRALVTRAARQAPVVLLDTSLRIDEHRDFDLTGLPGVMSAAAWMTPRTNLAVQMALIARARAFVGTCGGLAWLAPFMGVPTVALYDSDRLLATHLALARQAVARAEAASFMPLDLRALDALHLIDGVSSGAVEHP